MSLTFTINDGLGIFLPTDEASHAKQLKKVRELVSTDDGEEIRASKVIKGIKRMLVKDPFFIRGWALLGEILDEEGEEDEALQVHVEGYSNALKILPEDFAGPLNTENTEVQCFLRCHTRYIESLVRKEDYAAALAASRRQLELDPDDMYERELELGELAIMAGEEQEAESILFDQVEYRPTAYYSLGHIAFGRGDYALAASYLRRAFILAPYTVAILTGRPMPPNLFWECGPEAPDFEGDMSYMEMMGGDLWGSDEAAHGFLYWLSQTSIVLKEQAAFVGLSEKCFAGTPPDDLADDFDSEVEAEFEAIMAGIDPESSAALVVEVEDPDGDTKLWPWELLVLHHKRVAEDDDCECCDDDCDCDGDCDCGADEPGELKGK